MPKRLQIGHKAPNAMLETVAGEAVPLAETWQNGRLTLLIFLRHLG